MSYITEMDYINFLIQKGSDSVDTNSTKVIDTLLTAYKRTKGYKHIIDGYRYYHNDNDINRRTKKDVKIESVTSMANTQNGLTKLGSKEDYITHTDETDDTSVSHPFMKDIVDEKVDYLLSNPFTLSCKEDNHNTLLQTTFNTKLRNTIRETTRESINSGTAWLNIYFKDTNINFKHIPTRNLYPVYDDETGELDSMIHFYYKDVIVTTSGEMEIKKQEQVDVYDKTYVKHYVRDINSGKLQAEGEVKPLLLVNGIPLTLKQVPFVKLQYNEFEEPLITYLKSIIDDYDKTVSNSAKTIKKLCENIIVLKKMGGTDLTEVLRHLKEYGVLKAKGDGEVDLLRMSTDSISSLIEHANNDKSNIYKFAKGVDIESLDNMQLSGVALKILYTSLDLDVNTIEDNLQEMITDLLYFVNLYYELLGKGNFYDCEVDFQFSRNKTINDTEEIDKLIKLKNEGLLSRLTAMEKLTEIKDTAKELERLKDEQTKEE